MAWPRKPRVNDRCEKFDHGRDFMGPTVSRCHNPAVETVLDHKDNPFFLCEYHAETLWHEGQVKRNPKHFPVDPSSEAEVQ